MTKALFFAMALLCPALTFAQAGYSFALKLPVGAALTQRFGLQAEIPLSGRWSLDLEGRYLAKDWLPKGGEPFRALEDARGLAAHAGLRYYLSAPENAWRGLLTGQYRYRDTEFLGIFAQERQQHEGNLMAGAQYRPSAHGLLLELQVGGARVREEVTQATFTSQRTYSVPRAELLVGFAF